MGGGFFQPGGFAALQPCQWLQPSSTIPAPPPCLFLALNRCVATPESDWEYTGQLVYKHNCSLINLSINNPLLSVIAGYELYLPAMETMVQVT